MSQICIVHIYDDFTSIIDVHQIKKRYVFSTPALFTEPIEIAKYLKSKKTIYLLFNADNSVDESITLPSIIKNETTIQTALLAKIHDEEHIKEKLLLNKFYTLLDPTGESTTHHFEGLYESEVMNALSSVPNLEVLERISATHYALFSLSEALFEGKSYLCVYSQESKNIFVAANNGILLFSRIGELQSHNETERVAEQISDIIRTVAYVHQQYREVKFEFIAICGNIAESEIAPMQLQASTGLKITAIHPALIVDGLDPKTSQNYSLDIGMLFLKKSTNFLPPNVKAARELRFGNFIAMTIAFIFMLSGLYYTYDAYAKYEESINVHDTLQAQLMQALRQIDILDQTQLNEIISQLKSSSVLHHHFIDDMILFNPVLNLLKPSSLTFEENNGKGKIIITFQQKFKTLLDLYLFEKEFKSKIDSIKPLNSHITSSFKTDYNLLSFEATLNLGETKAPPPPRRRHRGGEE